MQQNWDSQGEDNSVFFSSSSSLSDVSGKKNKWDQTLADIYKTLKKKIEIKWMPTVWGEQHAY